MTAREVIKIITDDGWYFVKQAGSHKQYRHPAKTGKVTVPTAIPVEMKRKGAE